MITIQKESLLIVFNDMIANIMTNQCDTQSLIGHASTCTRAGTLKKVLESAQSDRQADNSYGSI